MKKKLIKYLPKKILINCLKINIIIHPIKFIKLRKKIKKIDNKLIKNKNIWINNLLNLSYFGTRYSAFIDNFIEDDIRRNNDIIIDDNVVLICIVKNDLLRIKKFINYYRNLGVKNFAILDDKSTDGTYEYLKNQKDVILYHSSYSYTTIRRQAWINRIIDDIGFNRWFIIVDSDELLDYDNKDKMLISHYINDLENNNIYRIKALLLDMFSKDYLYDERVKSEEDIDKFYKYFYNKYYSEKIIYDTIYQGGGRALFFFSKDAEYVPFVSKYPLIYVKSDDIILNSHYNFPFDRNILDKPKAILKHYKFLPNDEKKYKERIKSSNFFRGSTEYKKYESIELKDYQNKSKNLVEYKNFNSVDISNL